MLQNKQLRQGFTLVEVMIAVVVVAILAAIALPSYTEHLRKGRRAAAQSFLLDIAHREHQYLLDARAYANSVATLSLTTPAEVSQYYTIAITAADGPPPTFTASATPIAGTSQASDLGGEALTIDNTGKKTPIDKW